MSSLGRALILFGIVLIVAGVAIWAFPRVAFLGRLPGDIHIRRGNFTFYFPITTAIIISIVLTIVLSILRR
jgi:Protein of unknown function (DUF2905)